MYAGVSASFPKKGFLSRDSYTPNDSLAGFFFRKAFFLGARIPLIIHLPACFFYEKVFFGARIPLIIHLPACFFFFFLRKGFLCVLLLLGWQFWPKFGPSAHPPPDYLKNLAFC